MNSINRMHRVWLFELSAKGVRTLTPKGVVTLRVLAGGLWLTRSGDADDHFLLAGERLTLGPGRVVVETHDCSLARFELIDDVAEAAMKRPRVRRWWRLRPWRLAVAP